MRGCLLQLWICTTPDDVLGRLVWLTALPGPCQECLLACSITAAGSRLCVLLRCTGAAVRPRVEESVTHAAACVQAAVCLLLLRHLFSSCRSLAAQTLLSCWAYMHVLRGMTAACGSVCLPTLP
jgi:hypothetical protein